MENTDHVAPGWGDADDMTTSRALPDSSPNELELMDDTTVWGNADDMSTGPALADPSPDVSMEGDELQPDVNGDEDADDSSPEELSDGDEGEYEPTAPFDPMVHVQIGECVKCEVSKRFGVRASCHYLGFRDLNGIKNLETVARAGIGRVLDVAFEGCSPDDVVGLEISHPTLDTEIIVPFGPREKTTLDKVMEVIAAVQQSRRDLSFNGDMIIKATVVTPPSGSGYLKFSDAEFVSFFNQHSSAGGGNIFIKIENSDSSCFFRAVVVAQARIRYLKWDQKEVKWYQIRQGKKYKLQTYLAYDLKKKAGLAAHPPNRPCGMAEIQKVQRVMISEGFQLKIFSHTHFDTSIFDEALEGLEYIYIYHHHNHYTPMSSPRILFGKDYYCDLCQHAYSDLTTHTCPRICSFCRLPGPCLNGVREKCGDCSRFFPSHICFLRHKEPNGPPHHGAKRKRAMMKGKSVCDRFKRCLECGRVVSPQVLSPSSNHRCGTKYCRVCKINIPRPDILNHSCHMQIVGKTAPSTWRKKKPKPARFLFFDFETSAETVVGDRVLRENGQDYSLGPILEHKPNLCIVRKVCLSCKYFWLSRCDNPSCYGHECEKCVEDKPSCEFCGEHYHEFSGVNTQNDFCNFLFKEEHRGITAVAHNARGFDAHFLLRYLAENKRIPELIQRGLKILSLECMGVRVIDSYSFLPQSLGSLPKTFNEPELCKGFFPHLFNIRENETYIGPYPDPPMYGPSEMTASRRNAFYKWYIAASKEGEFDMRKEILRYCKADVDILLRCAMRFNDLFHSQTGLYPLSDAFTISQACNKVYREKFLKPNTIGIIPSGGYRSRERQSLTALEWLRWVSENRNGNIHHVMKGTERKVGHFKLDGWDETTNEGFEFHGCVFHSCPRCFKNRSRPAPFTNGLTHAENYQRTIERASAIRRSGVKLTEMWGCEWDIEKQSKEEIRNFLATIESESFLDIREALCGGRTNAISLYMKCGIGEKILYFDICSLYPWACKYGEMPVSHPKVITEGFQPITGEHNPYFGLIRCRVLPPRKLFHPVLPYKFENKLTFPLCRTCLETSELGDCHHSDDERALESVFVSVELDKALELGYRVLECKEIYHYESRSKFCAETGVSGLFSEYIDCFLKLKQEKSGWPSWVKSGEDADRYILEYEKREGIRLNPKEIEKNAGLRAIAKG